MTFPEEIKQHCAQLGTGVAARLCGLTARTLQLWILGKGNPNKATQRGVLSILRDANPHHR